MSRARSISKIHGIERELCFGLLAFFIVLLGLYGLFVGKSIINVVVREEVEFEIADVNSRLSGLELEYISQKNAISKNLAIEKGFHSVTKKQYVNRGTLLGRSLSQVSDSL